MNLSRRNLLKAGLGSAQIALLAKFGFWGARARADTGGGPDRLLTLFVPGGWMPSYVFCPLSQTQISRVIPPVRMFANENNPDRARRAPIQASPGMRLST